MVDWHPFDYENKEATAPPDESLVWIMEGGDTIANVGFFDGFTFRLWTGSDDCDVHCWARMDPPATDSQTKPEYIYRVTREDTHGGHYRAALTKIATKGGLSALIASAKGYYRYKIVKVERAKANWKDVTGEYVLTHKTAMADCIKRQYGASGP